jgi:hypothetical protein
MANQNELLRILRAIPPKWALGIIGLLIGYWLLQPVANRTFGWNLPTLVQIVNNEVAQPEKKPTVTSEKKSDSEVIAKKEGSSTSETPTTQPNTLPNTQPKTQTQTKLPTKGKEGSTATAEASESKPSVGNATTSKKPPTSPAQASNAVKKSPNISEPERPANKQGPTFGYLKSLGRDRYESPEGLVYAPGSEEGHRLKHIERHIVDMPDRPGPHGVFEGSMDEFLMTIDQGYQKASSKSKGTKTRDEDGMTIMEITFDKKIGFVGGSEGRRKGNPSTKRLRIVLNGDRLITAFPF